MTTDSPYVRSDGLEGSFDRQMDFIVCSVYELGWTKWGISIARMVKSADTADLKSADPYQVVGVQVPLRAPYNREKLCDEMTGSENTLLVSAVSVAICRLAAAPVQRQMF
jgi:hypothetical protein